MHNASIYFRLAAKKPLFWRNLFASLPRQALMTKSFRLAAQTILMAIINILKKGITPLRPAGLHIRIVYSNAFYVLCSVLFLPECTL